MQRVSGATAGGRTWGDHLRECLLPQCGYACEGLRCQSPCCGDLNAADVEIDVPVGSPRLRCSRDVAFVMSSRWSLLPSPSPPLSGIRSTSPLLVSRISWHALGHQEGWLVGVSAKNETIPPCRAAFAIWMHSAFPGSRVLLQVHPSLVEERKHLSPVPPKVLLHHQDAHR